MGEVVLIVTFFQTLGSYLPAIPFLENRFMPICQSSETFEKFDAPSMDSHFRMNHEIHGPKIVQVGTTSRRKGKS